jgi:hypothetical protein
MRARAQGTSWPQAQYVDIYVAAHNRLFSPNLQTKARFEDNKDGHGHIRGGARLVGHVPPIRGPALLVLPHGRSSLRKEKRVRTFFAIVHRLCRLHRQSKPAPQWHRQPVCRGPYNLARAGCFGWKK